MIQNNFTRFIAPLWENKRFFSIGAIHAILQWIHWPIVVYFFSQITNGIQESNRDQVTYILYMYIFFTIARYTTSWLLKTYSWNANFVLHQTIQAEYLPKYIMLENSYTEKVGTGKFVSIVNKWMEIWSIALADTRFRWIAWSISIIFSLLTLASTSIRFGIVGFVSIIFVTCFVLRFDTFALFRRNKRRDYENRHTERMIKVISSKFEVMQAWSIDKEIDALHSDLEQGKKMNVKTSDYVVGMFYVPRFFIEAWRVALVVFIWSWVISGQYTYGDFVAILWIFYVLDPIIMNGVEFFKDTTKKLSNVYKLFELFDEAPPATSYITWAPFIHTEWNILLKDVSFAYDAWQSIFTDFSLHIQPVKKTALVGNSGAWKTTLVKLIAWYLNPTWGEIYIDDQALSTLSLQSYYKHIWYLTQDPLVFDGTIRENLLYAVTATPTDDQIKSILKAAKCWFIYDLPHWLDTEIGERGVRLSWGQRQRLAIAKIMLKDPEIIILDEPTSALDSFAEQEVTEAMNNLFANRTVIIIAHRLQTVKHADEIIVLWSVDGVAQILERGTHDQLTKNKWDYYQMVELQSGF